MFSGTHGVARTLMHAQLIHLSLFSQAKPTLMWIHGKTRLILSVLDFYLH